MDISPALFSRWDQELQLKHSRSLLTASSFLALSYLHRRPVEVEQHWPTNLIVSGFFTPSLSSLSHAILDSTRNDYPRDPKVSQNYKRKAAADAFSTPTPTTLIPSSSLKRLRDNGDDRQDESPIPAEAKMSPT